jgi:hypothetical protein
MLSFVFIALMVPHLEAPVEAEDQRDQRKANS